MFWKSWPLLDTSLFIYTIIFKSIAAVSFAAILWQRVSRNSKESSPLLCNLVSKQTERVKNFLDLPVCVCMNVCEKERAKRETHTNTQSNRRGGGPVSVCVSLSELHLALHLNNLTEGVSSKGPEPVTRNNPQAAIVFPPHIRSSIPPPCPPSLVNQSNMQHSTRLHSQAAVHQVEEMQSIRLRYYLHSVHIGYYYYD